MSAQEQSAVVVREILRRKVSAIIRTDDAQLARSAMQAAVAGGFKLCEFTLTTPGAYELISEFANDSSLVVGAGTVLSVAQVREAIDAGARFIVSPVCDPDVISRAHTLGAATIPGTFTPNEMQLAASYGADFVKLFPEPPRLTEYVRAILGPLPALRIFPTAGVTVDNLADVLSAGAAGAGFVRSLFVPSDLQQRRFSQIEKRAVAITEQFAKWQKAQSGD